MGYYAISASSTGSQVQGLSVTMLNFEDNGDVVKVEDGSHETPDRR